MRARIFLFICMMFMTVFSWADNNTDGTYRYYMWKVTETKGNPTFQVGEFALLDDSRDEISGLLCVGGTNSAHNPISENWDNLTSGSPSSKYCSAPFTKPSYFYFDAGSAVKPAGYRIYTANDDATYSSRMPNSWALYGSKTSSKSFGDECWVLIDEIEHDQTIQARNLTPYDFVIGNSLPDTPKYFYTEDFETGTFSSSWKQDYIYGTCNWIVKSMYGSSVLRFAWEDNCGTRQGTRAIMPVFNFSDNKNALLELDYRNMLIDMSVVYRTSSTGEWKTLKTLNNHYFSSMTEEDVKNAEEHIALVLPDLSSDYEVAIASDFSWRGWSKSFSEIGTVDNIAVTVDFDVYTETRAPTSISNKWAEIYCYVIPGIETELSKGIEWSTDMTKWNQVAATDYIQSLKLTDLPPGTKIYYRTYAQSGSKSYKGRTKSFITLWGDAGSGTETDPFIISSAEDWEELVKIINNGGDCSGLYYALGQSLEFVPSQAKGAFNGHFDGRGYTITMDKGSNRMFDRIDADGVLENLNIVCNSFSNNNDGYCMICETNNGLINNCNLRIENLYLDKSLYFGGLCRSNNGTVCNSSSFLNMPIENTCNYGGSGAIANMAWVGGLVWYNLGLIDHCSFDGYMAANNNSTLGGITANNWYESDEVRGKITNCINKGTLEIGLVDGKSWGIEIGGMAGTNYGSILYCINEGTMKAHSNAGDCMEGGISGWNCRDSKMYHCLNRGKIEIEALKNDAATGGITGFSDYAETAYCINTGEIDISGTRSGNCNGVVGWHRGDNTHDCYYGCEVKDDKAEFVTSWEETINALNTSAGFECWKLKDGVPYLAWEDGEETYCLNLNTIVDFTSTTITGSFSTVGSCTESGIYYKKEGDSDWKIIKSTDSSVNHKFKITGLTPLSEYEIMAYMIKGSSETMYSESQKIVTDFSTKGSSDDPHLINTANDLSRFARIVTQGNKMQGCIVRLTSDLNMHASEGQVWTDFVGYFDGEFDGGGHYIYNMKTLSNENHFGEGLFTQGSSYIHDLNLYDVEMTYLRNDDDVFYIGGIAGICDKMERCSFVGKIIFQYGSPNGFSTWCSGGGLAGDVHSYVKDSYALAEFNTNWTYNLGGVVGRGQAQNCYYGLLDGKSNMSKPVGILGNLNRLGSDPAATAEDCYFLESAMSTSYKNGKPMSMTQMKDGTLLNKLSSKSPSVWATDIQGHKLDGGYPVLASQLPFPYENGGSDPDEPEKPDDPEYTRGDVNNDGKINVGDITSIANIILGTSDGTLIEAAADANLDGKINVGDITSVAIYILNGAFTNSTGLAKVMSSTYTESMNDYIDVSVSKNQTATISVVSAKDISSIQFDICLPKGLSIKKELGLEVINQVKGVAKGHALEWQSQSDGSMRIINYSATNRHFVNPELGVVDIDLVPDGTVPDGTYNVCLKNIVLASDNGTIEIDDRMVTLFIAPETTGINNVSHIDTPIIYNLNGMRKNCISKGINIVNSKKIVVR